MKAALLIMALMISTAQAGTICDIAEEGVEIASETIAEKLDCTNKQQIEDDIAKLIKLEKICKTEGFTKVNSKLMCKFISKTTASYAVKKVPETWECNKKATKKKISKAIYDSCIKILE